MDELVSSERENLVAVLRASLQGSVFWARRNCRTKSIQEPDIIAALLKDAFPNAFQAWAPIFAHYGVALRSRGVYCHQSPYVDHYAGRCETGDLLIAHFHINPNGPSWNTALLLQAKIGTAQTGVGHYRLTSTDDLTQLKLYTDWPKFQYATTALKGQTRDVFPKNRHSGAQYLFLPESIRHGNPPGSFSVRPPSELLVHGGDFARTLVYFLRGLRGRGFSNEAHAQRGIGWSRVVWDLLRSSHVFKRSNLGLLGIPRVQWYGPHELIDDPQSGGPSTLVAVTGPIESSQESSPFDRFLLSDGNESD